MKSYLSLYIVGGEQGRGGGKWKEWKKRVKRVKSVEGYGRRHYYQEGPNQNCERQC